MAYDQAAAKRLRTALKRTRNIAEQKMFGGICFMWRGNMLCGTGWHGVMFRVGKEQEAAALKLPGASRMAMAGRQMHGFVWIKPDRCKGAALKKGIALAKKYIGPMPAKKKKRA
ncbi:MAG TPA: TfoX/Sxy family protein [Xanthobacteraceae bacterium]